MVTLMQFSLRKFLRILLIILFGFRRKIIEPPLGIIGICRHRVSC